MEESYCSNSFMRRFRSGPLRCICHLLDLQKEATTRYSKLFCWINLWKFLILECWLHLQTILLGIVVAAKPNDLEEKIMRQNNRNVSYSEIVSITGNFQQVIGKGGFGKVYSGHLSDGTQVAVKMLSSPSIHGSKQCRTEASFFIYIYLCIYIY